ncbi:MAG: uracil-DNA glycosylase [Oscillospiraceae bacterium]|nr:uracil-DNA glycosylase [Oscillospiraceae bacterium]
MKDFDFYGWNALLEGERSKPYYGRLLASVEAAYASATVYPPREQLFTALRLTPPERTRCVILGQDPYHEPNQAMGLAFSVPDGTPLPPSLRNIYKELESDLGVVRTGGDLTDWAQQGVLLLNATLSVEQGRANSHASFGWQKLTDAVILAAASLPQKPVFVLWGGYAGKKAALLPPDIPVLLSAHPSPLSAYRGFFGSRPFSRVNALLSEPIRW